MSDELKLALELIDATTISLREKGFSAWAAANEAIAHSIRRAAISKATDVQGGGR